MKIAANLSLMFTEVPLLDRFQAAKSAGFDAVEIQFPYEAPCEALSAAKEDAQVDVILINVPAGDLMAGGEGLACVPEREDDYAQALELCAEYAETLDVACVNVLSGRCHEASELHQRMNVFQQNLKKTADRLQPLGITTTFEAINTTDMPGFLIHSAKQMWDLLSELQHPVIKAQYDLYHMQMMQEDLQADLAQYMAKIGHIQFADCPGRGEPGAGAMDLAGLFEQIAASDYQGHVAAEYRPTTETTLTLDWMNLADQL